MDRSQSSQHKPQSYSYLQKSIETSNFIQREKIRECYHNGYRRDSLEICKKRYIEQREPIFGTFEI